MELTPWSGCWKQDDDTVADDPDCSACSGGRQCKGTVGLGLLSSFSSQESRFAEDSSTPPVLSGASSAEPAGAVLMLAVSMELSR